MSERTLRRLAVLLGALVIVWGLARLLGRDREGGGAGGALTDTLAALAVDTLHSATLRVPGGETLELRREAGRWTINGFAADSAAVRRLLSALAEARVAGLIARNAANHARLGVATDSTLAVELRSVSAAHTLLVGNDGPRYPGSYVRLPGDDDVYEVLGDLRNALLRTVSEWRDKTIARVDTSAIVSLTIERNGQATTLVRGDSTWAPAHAPGTTAASTAVAAILSELARFDAAGFAADNAFAGSDTRRVIALNAAGDTLADLAFAGTESDWFARAQGGTQVFTLAAYRVDRIAPRREDLLPTGS